jgi:hypothetical protein
MSYVDIVLEVPPGPELGVTCDPPGPESPRFVEVENAKGKSINFGEWVKRPDGYWALRIPMAAEQTEDFQARLPRSMEGEGLRIVPAYTEAGYFGEANCITVTDGERTALYVPLRHAPRRVRQKIPRDLFKGG